MNSPDPLISEAIRSESATPRRRFGLALMASLLVGVGACAIIGYGLDQGWWNSTDLGNWPRTTPAERTPDRLRVLFIGNSFTGYNGGQALILRQLAASAGQNPVIDQVAIYGATWKQLWDTSKARQVIGQGQWDYVILQDHSQAALRWPVAMKNYARLFSDAIDQVGARPIFFMTWANRNMPFDQRIIARAYTDLATEDDGLLAPVGVAWQNALKARPKLSLYNIWDKKHPNAAGSYLTACVFYSLLFHHSPHGLIGRISEGHRTYINLSTDDAEFLQDIAWKTVSQGKMTPATRP